MNSRTLNGTYPPRLTGERPPVVHLLRCPPLFQRAGMSVRLAAGRNPLYDYHDELTSRNWLVVNGFRIPTNITEHPEIATVALPVALPAIFRPRRSSRATKASLS
jgi:hypothetical protein